jgi:hypothetical protein
MSYGFVVKLDDHIPNELLEVFKIPTSLVIYHGSESRQDVAKHFIKIIVEIAKKK